MKPSMANRGSEVTVIAATRVSVALYDAFWQECHAKGLTVSEALRYFMHRMTTKKPMKSGVLTGESP